MHDMCVPKPKTLGGGSESHALIAGLFMCDFSYSCAADYNTATESASRGPSAIVFNCRVSTIGRVGTGNNLRV